MNYEVRLGNKQINKKQMMVAYVQHQTSAVIAFWQMKHALTELHRASFHLQPNTHNICNHKLSNLVQVWIANK